MPRKGCANAPWPVPCLHPADRATSPLHARTPMLYQAYQLQSDLMSPLRLLAQGSSAALWLGKTEGSLLRKLSASMEVFSRLRLTHSRPAYGIASVKVGERDFAVTEEAVLTMPF